MKPLCTLIVILAGLVAAAPAAAQVTVDGSGEPAFTNSTQNTQWVRWQGAGSGVDDYRLHIRYYRNGVQVHELRTPVSKNGGSGFWMNWDGVATLQEGSTYAICVRGEYSFDNDSLYYPDGPDSCQTASMEGKRTSTTIDRTKPTVSVAAAGGAEFTKDPGIPLSIGFQDTTAGPYPATFLCVEAGADPCESGYGHSQGCSVPAGGGKSTTFNCSTDASGLPDGPVTVCAIGADASVPDNPSSADQTRNASQANRSDAQCDTVTLDRNAPTLAVSASKTLIRTGESVAFSADASDPGSGIDSNTLHWSFDDGTPAVAGALVNRSFDRPGTYVVTLRAKDRAGNESTAEKTITVEAPPTDSTPKPGDDAIQDNPTVPVTGSGLASVQIGSVTVFVPKRVRLSKVKQLVLGARAAQAGQLTLHLVRGRKVYSKLTVGLSPGESRQRLRLPKRMRAGSYAVKIAFKAAGTSWSAAGRAKVVLRKG